MFPGRWNTAAVLAVASAVVLAGAHAGRRENARQSEPWADGGDGEIERFLLSAQVVEIDEIGDGITLPERIVLRLGDETCEAVFKDVDEEYAHPDSGSPRRDDLYFTDKWQNEVAAYRLDRLIGLHHVPVTVMRTIRDRRGSVQLWVDASFSERERFEEKRQLTDPAHYARDADLLRVFDALIYNVDRTQENILIEEPESRIWLIDQSRAFRLRPQLPAVDRKDPPIIPRVLADGMIALDRNQLDEALGELLTPSQIKAILKRRDRILEWVVIAD